MDGTSQLFNTSLPTREISTIGTITAVKEKVIVIDVQHGSFVDYSLPINLSKKKT